MFDFVAIGFGSDCFFFKKIWHQEVTGCESERYTQIWFWNS